jgi:hypothetical protein
MIEILPDIKGIDFSRAWEKRVEATVDPDTTGVPQRVGFAPSAFSYDVFTK